MSRNGLVIKSSLVSAAALIVAAVFASSPALADSSVVIASNSAHKTLIGADIDGTDPIAIAYQKNSDSYLTWSTDGGQTFGTPQILRAGNKAQNPRVAVCDDNLWAASDWPTSAGTNIGLDLVDLSSDNLSDHWMVASGGDSPDVACLSDAESGRPLEKTVGVAWLTTDGHAQIEIIDPPCADGCNSPYSAVLGRARPDEGIKIAAVDDGFVVTWVAHRLVNGLDVQHFSVQRVGGNINVTADPVVHLLSNKHISAPVIDADGTRVVIAYGQNDNIHMRISDDSGATFGPKSYVSRLCGTGNCVSRATSISARNGQILVEVKLGGGDPPSFETQGKLTSNDGAAWTRISDWNGTQLGELLDGAAGEIGDKHDYTDPIYRNVPQRITFTETQLN